jgi:hypothetical protein
MQGGFIGLFRFGGTNDHRGSSGPPVLRLTSHHPGVIEYSIPRDTPDSLTPDASGCCC